MSGATLIPPDRNVLVEGLDPTQKLQKELASAINKCSAENDSNTPDFILAKFLSKCLDAWNKANYERERWYGVNLHIGTETPSLPLPDRSVLRKHSTSTSEHCFSCDSNYNDCPDCKQPAQSSTANLDKWLQLYNLGHQPIPGVDSIFVAANADIDAAVAAKQAELESRATVLSNANNDWKVKVAELEARATVLSNANNDWKVKVAELESQLAGIADVIQREIIDKQAAENEHKQSLIDDFKKEVEKYRISAESWKESSYKWKREAEQGSKITKKTKDQ